MLTEVIFDLETKKFFDETGTNDPADLGVSVVSLYSRLVDDNFKEVSGKMMSFFENDFDQMWKYFNEANRIIGFNSISFDVNALRPYAPPGFSKLPHFDILAWIKEKYGFRVGLNKIAMETLGAQKIAHGSEGIEFWNKKQFDQLQKYCEMDVALTRDVYDFGFVNKILKYRDHWNNVAEMSVDFSYPPTPLATQTSLF